MTWPMCPVFLLVFAQSLTGKNEILFLREKAMERKKERKEGRKEGRKEEKKIERKKNKERNPEKTTPQA